MLAASLNVFACETDSLCGAGVHQGAFGSWRAPEFSVSLIWICEHLETFLGLFYCLYWLG